MITKKQKIFEFLLAKADGGKKFVWPSGIAQLIKTELGISQASTSHYLAELEDMRLISRGYDDSLPIIIEVEIWATEFPVTQKPPKPARAVTAMINQRESPVAEETSQAADGVVPVHSENDPDTAISSEESIPVENALDKPDTRSEEKKIAVILVDFDNAVSRALAAGYTLSFLRLREYIRRYGPPEFVEVFLSPKSDRPEVKNMLWASGYFVIACPMRNKDKDAVDETIRARARHWAELSDIRIIVIVSQDADFSEGDFPESLRDKGKIVEFVRTSALRAELDGPNIALKALENDETKKRFSRLLKLMMSGISVSAPAARKDTEFLEGILNAAINFFKVNNRPHAVYFRTLKDRLERAILPKWSKVFHPREINAVLSVMIDEKIIQRQQGGQTTYYELNPKHPLVLKAAKKFQNRGMRVSAKG